MTLSGCSTADTSTTVSQPDADLPAAREAIALTRAGIALITATTARHPALRGELASLLAMHHAHLRRLRTLDASGTPATPATKPVPAAADAALTRVRTAESARATRLDALALAAHSGGFARMLGAMAAAVDQHLAVLPR